MKTSHPAGPILASLALALVGCVESTREPAEPAAKVEKPREGPSRVTSREPPIDPSPVPSLPATPRGDLDRKDEARPESKKGEETPKPVPPK